MKVTEVNIISPVLSFVITGVTQESLQRVTREPTGEKMGDVTETLITMVHEFPAVSY